MPHSVNPLEQLPLWLYGIGLGFIVSGMVWAQLTRSARSIQISPGVSAEQDQERTGLFPRKGVRAIFSSDEDWASPSSDGLRESWISSGMLVNLAGWALFLGLYALLVQEYTSSASLQSWVQQRFTFGDYFLNYYAFLAVTSTAVFLVFRVLFLRRRRLNLRRMG
jgi:uncharacterized membrane protein